MAESSMTVTLGAREYPLAPLRLGRMKKLRRELEIVMQSKTPASDRLPDETTIDAYAAITCASACAADPTLTAAAFLAAVDELPPFGGIGTLFLAASRVLSLSLGDDIPGEATSPSDSTAPSTSTGSTD